MVPERGTRPLIHGSGPTSGYALWGRCGPHVPRSVVSRACFAAGVAGAASAGACLIAVAVRGRFIPPEGKMLDAATFCFGVGAFTLTVALPLPFSCYSPPARRRWRRALQGFAVYGLVLEPLQAFRGLDPRFTEEGDGVDVVAGVVFGLPPCRTPCRS